MVSINNWLLGFRTVNVLLTGHAILISVEEVNKVLEEAANTTMKGILDYSNEPLVSIDYKKDSHSSIIDGLSTMMIGSNMVKIVSWYDNEWGYSNRVVDLAKYVANKM